jgi:nucleotide-binding universal stress UspA family protein
MRSSAAKWRLEAARLLLGRLLREDHEGRMTTAPAIRHVLVAHDFSETAEAALAYALTLSGKLDARLTVVHVYDVPSDGTPDVLARATDWWPKQFEVVAREALGEVVARVEKGGSRADSALRRGVPWREIIASAKDLRADLVVVGSEGRSGVGRALLGSVAERVARTAPCPVLVVRRGAT